MKPGARKLAAAVVTVSGAMSCSTCAAGASEAVVDLQHQAVSLQLDWPGRQAKGHTVLTLKTRVDTQALALDAGHLAIDTVGVVGGPALAFQYDGGDRDGGLQVTLDRPYPAGQTLQLRIDYRTRWVNHSDPQNLWGSTGRGLRFFEPTTSDARKRRQLWAAQGPGTLRYWVPGLDAVAALRSSELSVTVPAPLTAVSGGAPMATETHADGTRTFRWRSDRPHAPHRLALVVGEYLDQPQLAPGLSLHNLGYPDEAQATADSVVQLPDMLRFFTALTGQPLPGPAYTQVFVQDLPWGQVGNGLAVQTENMVDDHGTHADYLYLWDGLQAETLAAQWFGVLLPACDVRHGWLERGMAHHLAALYAEHHNGRDEALLWYVQGDRSTVLGDWQAGVRQPLVPEQLDDPRSFAEGNTPWARGAAVLQLLRRTLGDDTWRQVLRHHVRAHAGQPVCTEHLRRSAEQVSGQDLGWFFSQWTERADHPTFDVSWQHDAAAGVVMLSLKQTQDGPPFTGPMDIDIDGRIERVWLQARAENRFRLPAAQPPRLLHVDHEGSWIKELRFAKPPAELLYQLRHSTDPLGRHWAMTELARLSQAADAPAGLRQDLEAALLDLAQDRRRYWRVRFNALNQLRSLLGAATPATAATPVTPATPGPAVVLHPDTRDALLALVQGERSWLRASALATLGLSRDPALAPLYLQHLRDPSDRVINNAAIALGSSRSPLALDALLALPAHPSWKNQSLISALAGLKALADPRGAALARRALADVQSPRWTLSTPVWDYRLAAAQTLAALGQGADSVPLLLGHVERALAEGDVNDLFSNLLLLATLGDARARPLLPPLRQCFAGDAAALKALDDLSAQLEAAIAAQAAASPPG